MSFKNRAERLAEGRNLRRGRGYGHRRGKKKDDGFDQSR